MSANQPLSRQSNLLGSIWTDKNGHRFRVHSVSYDRGEPERVGLEYLPPNREALTFGELLARFEPEGAE